MNSILTQLKDIYCANQIVATDGSNSLTRYEFERACASLITSFKKQGISRLALYADNGLNWLLIDLACQHADICLLPIPTFFSPQQITHAIENSNIDAVITDKPLAFKQWFTTDIKLPINGALIGGSLKMSLHRLDNISHNNKLPNKTEKITFTSGSTGNPKGVCLSNDQLITQAAALKESVGLDKTRHLCLLPLSTLLENIAGVYSPLLSGGQVIVPSLSEIGFTGSSNLDANKFLTTISRYQPNTIILTPQLLLLLINAINSGWKKPDSLTFIAVGGSKVAPELLQQAHHLALPVYEGYGLSECASVVCLNNRQNSLIGSVGKALPHLDIMLKDNEIIVAGNVMLGYANDPSSWNQLHIRTGDLGHIDKQGYLHIDGRKKNQLISSYGRNISPEWVESELLSTPTFQDCVVFGDAKPFCIALITPRNSALSDSDIEQYVKSKNSTLPDYAHVKKWLRLKKPLTTIEGLVTDNGRPKRDTIYRHFEHQIESLYA